MLINSSHTNPLTAYGGYDPFGLGWTTEDESAVSAWISRRQQEQQDAIREGRRNPDPEFNLSGGEAGDDSGYSLVDGKLVYNKPQGGDGTFGLGFDWTSAPGKDAPWWAEILARGVGGFFGGPSGGKAGGDIADWISRLLTKKDISGTERTRDTGNKEFDDWFRDLDRGYVPAEYRDRDDMNRDNDGLGGGRGGEDVSGDYVDPSGNGQDPPDPSKPGGGGGPYPPFTGPTGRYDYGYSTSPVSLTGPQVNPQGNGGFDLNALISSLMQNGGK